MLTTGTTLNPNITPFRGAAAMMTACPKTMAAHTSPNVPVY